MAKSRLFYVNLVDTASAISASTEDTDMEVEKVQVEMPQIKWGATAKTDEYITIDLGSSTATTSAIIAAHNLDVGGTFTLRKSNDNFAANNVLVGTFTHAAGLMILTYASTSERYWRFRFQSTAANPQVGRVFLGTYFEVADDWEPGFVNGIEDLSVVITAMNGVRTSISKPTRDIWPRTFPIFSEAEHTNWETFRDTVGVHQPFFVQLDPDDNPSTGSKYCRLESPLQIPNVFNVAYRVNPVFVEEI